MNKLLPLKNEYRSSQFQPAFLVGLDVIPAETILPGKRLGGQDIHHHSLVQGVRDGCVETLGDGHAHEGLVLELAQGKSVR